MDTEVDIEMLDLDRFPDRDHRAKLTRLLAEKFRQRPPDLIVAQGARSPGFSDGFRTKIGKQLPIVYTMIDESERRSLILPPKTTGVNVASNIIDQVKLIRKLLPGTMHLAFVGNTVLPGTYPLNISEEMAETAKQVEVISLIDLPIGELVQRVATVPEHSVIFYLGIKADQSGRVLVPQEGLTILSQFANCPIFVPTYNLMGFGATGGLLVRPEDGTPEVAAMVMHILAGTDVSSIAPQRIETRKPVFDYRQLQKWHIVRNSLPADSELMFYEPTMWERYSREIIVVIAILLVQTALIVMLIIERRRRRRAELEFRRSMVDLAQLNRSTALGELSASIAHELNQPLAAMLSNAEAADVLLRRDPPGLEEAEQALADIRRDSQRAGDIIRSMRSLFTKTDFALELVNLNEVVGEMLRFVSWEAGSRGVTLNALLDGEIPEVMADRVQLDQVVLNLLTNAIEAAQSGAGAREVKVGTVWTGGAEIEIFVEDGGPGIAEDVIARIFEPHYTTKPQGMGMGLSISRNIIESHGSRLNVTNLSGGGARFWFTLKARTKA